jgi:hypothetical protein
LDSLKEEHLDRMRDERTDEQVRSPVRELNTCGDVGMDWNHHPVYRRA